MAGRLGRGEAASITKCLAFYIYIGILHYIYILAFYIYILAFKIKIKLGFRIG